MLTRDWLSLVFSQYFYAVICCDTTGTAEKLYGDLDGHDYESSGAKLDLRFIPDDMEFEEAPKDFCDSLPSAGESLFFFFNFFFFVFLFFLFFFFPLWAFLLQTQLLAFSTPIAGQVHFFPLP